MHSYRAITSDLKLNGVFIISSILLSYAPMEHPRLILHTIWIHSVFGKVHTPSHSGVRLTQMSISQQFVEHGMKRDILWWCKPLRYSSITRTALRERPLTID
ncbi:hypothetical protein PoB_003471400 [Plakobranchus ocellatus]|uniref:Uncharacterized protein n=1 Tax=Plakobranchus ocellatus TaxID=259542 RepID=A0AAV4AKF2_9GAST|nr:hypothetical protein PoB_003471400 [Plakobranchus ocellatus]